MTKQRATLLVADSVPLPSELYSVSGRDVVTVYKDILDNRDTANDVLTKEEEHELKKAKHLLIHRECVIVRLITGRDRQEESRRLQKYRAYEARYFQLKTDLDAQSDSAERAHLTEQISNVRLQWERKGHKAAVGAALEQLDEVAVTSAPAFWAKVDAQYHANIRHISGNDVPLTTFLPDASSWSNSEGWKDLGVAGRNIQAKVITILRPWLNVEVVTTRKWSWAPGRMRLEDVEIADGLGVSLDEKRDVVMPLLPTGVVLLRVSEMGGTSNPVPAIVGMICLIVPKQP